MSQLDTEGHAGDGYPGDGAVHGSSLKNVINPNENPITANEQIQADAPNPPDQGNHEEQPVEPDQNPEHVDDAEQDHEVHPPVEAPAKEVFLHGSNGEEQEEDRERIDAAACSARPIPADDTLPKTVSTLNLDDNPVLANEEAQPDAPEPPDENPPPGHQESDENDDSNEEPGDDEEIEEAVEADALREGAQQDAGAVPFVENQPGPSFPDIFEKVIRIFANPNEFYKFSCLSHGLRLDDEVIRSIQHKRENPEEKMHEILEAWLKKNCDATPESLDDIATAYRSKKNNPTGYRAGAAAQNNENGGQEPLRMEDAFEEVRTSFTNITSFKKFARASGGLQLSFDIVREISDSNHGNTYLQQIELLRLWQQKTNGATAEKLLNIRARYG